MFNKFFITKDSEIKFFFVLATALALLFIISFTIGSRVERKDNSVPTKTASGEFPVLDVKAKSAYIYDVRTKTVLFALNENIRLPLASLSKLMAALVAYELSPDYGTVMVTREAIATEGDSGLKAGERWSLKNLLDFSLLSSSNDGIKAVALSLGALSRAEAGPEEIVDDFVRKMNYKAAELDLKNTYFWNETGLDESEVKGGAYGTAKDLTALMEYIISYYPEMLEATRQPSATFKSDKYNHAIKNTNALADEIPNLLGSKTGFTSTAGGNLTFAFDPELGRPIIVTILGSTEKGRFEDAKALINATMQYINEN
ncbi:MAG: D-alanyl-D-alanine carboxypeptidase [Candidatus Zambryskibacteria bacterium]|nr:D-alanyl-D-alanine carboxypeptidase [Candidatus Zambryskibacteria bacterium]